jgi:exopolysaccharide biosynthesis polyprenyl glycosylphosphotransferase
MPKSPESVRRDWLRLADVAILVVAFPMAFGLYVRLASHRAAWLPPLESYWPAITLALVLWVAISCAYELYASPVAGSAKVEILGAIRALVTVAVILAAVAFLTKAQTVPRLLAVAYLAISLVSIVGVRIAWRMAAIATNASNARRYAVVGVGGIAREIVRSVAARPEWRMQFAGFIVPDSMRNRSRGPVLGTLSSLGAVLEEEVLDVVIFAVPREWLGQIQRGVALCEEQGIEVRISLDALRFGPGRMTIMDLDDVPMLAFTRTPSDVAALAVKRFFDVAASAAVLVVLAPVLAAIALAIRLDSPGPVLFRQRRVGLNGRPFDMLKFRSMHQDAEKKLDSLRACNEMTGPVFKIRNDPRITRVGRFLRRTSLDEFPQFWNVFMGHMSVVGPRPPIPAEVRQYKRWQRRRLSMKPGITCLWQISGRNNVDFDRWMELDLEYIDRWSLWADLEICLRTVPAVLSTRGAH